MLRHVELVEDNLLMDFVPPQPQLLGDSFLAGGFQPGNGEGFKKSREAAGWFSPGQLQHAHAMSRALGARRLGVEDGAVLAGVQVAPLSLGLMVIELAGGTALGTGPTGEV